ncbi:MAG: hypothetical protein ACXU8U_08690 [Asticcacaulis sp.]
MNRSSHFLIRLALLTPVILTHRTTLDAILAGLLFDESGDLDHALSALPLARHEGVWCGSSVFLQSPVLTDELVLGASVRPVSLDPALLRPKKTGRYVAIDPSGGDFRNRQTLARAYATPAAYFMGEGDLDEVRRLMRGMTGMGKRRASGYGQIDIEASEFIALDYPRQQGVLMLSDGTPSRPIPVDVWAGLRSLAPVLHAVVRYAPPYNLTEPVECVLPVHHNIDAGRVNSLLM